MASSSGGGEILPINRLDGVTFSRLDRFSLLPEWGRTFAGLWGSENSDWYGFEHIYGKIFSAFGLQMCQFRLRKT